MLLPRRVRRLPIRHVLAVAALFAQLIAATGAPVLSPRAAAKNGATPFPCQNHPCGCTTSEQGWAGDCCCFTLEQKLAWAEERGIEPPAHVRPAVEARKKKAKPSCCAKHETRSCCEPATELAAPPHADEPAATEAPAVRWVAGVFAQKCRGDGPAGLLKVEVSLAPTHPSEVRASRPECGRVAAFDSHATRAPRQPPVPPPRVS